MLEFKPSIVPALRTAFEDFVAQTVIDSKETGPARLHPYRAQIRFLDGVFDGLKEDKHWHVILKARQLGITTISLALDLFWISVFDGLQGAIVTDSEPNKEKIRLIIERMLDSLPKSHSIPIYKHNRNGLVLRNGSSIDYLVAGKRKNGGLGRSRAFNFLHGTECSSWGDSEGFESLEKSLAEDYPARLYIWESTGRGFNLFWEMWQAAKEDDLTKSANFIGWWAKEAYEFDPSKSLKNSQLFERYGRDKPTPGETKLIADVQALYGWSVTMEQLAWYRHKKDPAGDLSLDDDTGAENSIIEQELPWTEDQAFMLTGSNFFAGPDVTVSYKDALNSKFLGYRYRLGEDFLATAIEQVKNEKSAQLKVWEEPEENSVYVIGADPAYGSSDEADRYAIQIFKCFADGMEQVAEFCAVDLKTYQFAWVVAHLAGAYSNGRLLLEVNGPGEAVMVEFRNLKSQLNNPTLRMDPKAQGFKDVLGKIRQYIYTRPDSIGGGTGSWHWKTTTNNKSVILNQLRDGWAMNKIKLRSTALLDEMRRMVQDGMSIKAEGHTHDDRVIAAALATRAWIDGERKALAARGYTKEEAEKSQDYTHEDYGRMLQTHIIQDFFKKREAAAVVSKRTARRSGRYNW